MLQNHKAIDSCQHPLKGKNGLPENYPFPATNNNLLFYIQRNNNHNTIVYEINRLHDGRVNEEFPMHVFWIRYAENGEQKELNLIQNEMAYGYHSKSISKNCFEFSFVSYAQKQFFIDKKPDKNFGVFTKINESYALLSNIYVFAENTGAFPTVNYVELYGYDTISQEPVFQCITI